MLEQNKDYWETKKILEKKKKHLIYHKQYLFFGGSNSLYMGKTTVGSINVVIFSSGRREASIDSMLS